MQRYRTSILFLPAFFIFLSAGAQDLNETLSDVGEIYARAYVDPLATAISADLNAGLFHTAFVGNDGSGFHFYLGVKASTLFLNDSQKSFDLDYTGRVSLTFDIGSEPITMSLPANFRVENAPSIFGEEEAPFATVSVRHDTTFTSLGLTLPVAFDTTLTPRETIGGVLNTDVAPLLVPHASIGTVFGTDLLVRWLPQIDIPDFGAIELFGIGVRHSLNQYVPSLPFDLAIQTAWQQVNTEDVEGDDVVRVNTFAVNAAISKRFGVLTLYSGIQSSRSDVRFQYVFDASDLIEEEEIDPISVDFNVLGLERTRGILGLSLKLGPVHTNADVGFGDHTVVSAGFGFAFLKQLVCLVAEDPTYIGG